MLESLQYSKRINSELLQQRLIPIKSLLETDHESYEIMKDHVTSEHYLHYAYLHFNVAMGNEQEVFHHMLPLQSDDVLSLVLGEQEYTYPTVWTRAFLRNGPDGDYVWFDPIQEQEADEAMAAQEVQEKLQAFKASGKFSEEDVAEFMAQMDKIWKQDT